jgi:hypothetical protein
VNVLGFIESGAQLGLQLLTMKPKRGLVAQDGGSSIVAHATIEEVHQDELEVTEHPVEQGTVIADHAFVRPADLIITAGWSNSPNSTSLLGAVAGFAAAQSSAARALIGAVELGSGVINLLSGGVSPVQKAYDNLLAAYQARTLFTVYTGKRPYKNMIIKSLSTTTDKDNENSMLIRIVMRQILMAQTQTVTVPDSSVMSNPASTASPEDAGVTSPVPAPNINVTALP